MQLVNGFTKCLRVTLLGVMLSGVVQGADTVWIEAEQPTSLPVIAAGANPLDKGYDFKGWGTVDYLSGGKVLFVGIDAAEAEKRLGKDGAVFGYAFDTDKPGKQEVWGRVGFEFVRSDMEWRVDQGEWKTIKSDDLTCDLMSIQTWNEIAWIKFGDADIAAGKHNLEIRFTYRSKMEKDKVVPQGVLFYLDALAISATPFVPNGKFKPGEDYAGEALKKAEATVFELPAAVTPGERSAVELNGAWRIARWDEQAVPEAERLKIPMSLPADLSQKNWYPIPIPGDRNRVLPAFEYSHRNILRTRVNVPASLAGRSFILDFQHFSMIVGVFVNGTYCGYSKDCYAAWSCDVTAALKPGQVNEIVVVLKDRYYALADCPEPVGCRGKFNLPDGAFAYQGVSMMLDMPVSGMSAVGILEPVTLVAVGKVYVDDVFAKPSVRKKELGLEVTLRNPTAASVKVRLDNEVFPWSKGTPGKAELSFPARELEIGAGKTETILLAANWANPKLWWPDEPNLYNVKTTVTIGGVLVDVKSTRFGFREWEWDSHLFKLNGVKWQLWADLSGPWNQDVVKYKEHCLASGMNMTRYWNPHGWGGYTTRQTLDQLDEQGIPTRRSGVFDGEGCNYGLFYEKDGKRVGREKLFNNWYDQTRAWIKAERNHPSIFIWSIENEVTFINSCNFGSLPVVEPFIRKGAAMVEAMDPTRPTMVDGGRALMDQSMPVNGCHYNDMNGGFGPWTPMDASNDVDGKQRSVTVSWRDFPDAAYMERDLWYRTYNRYKGAWPMVKDKPIFHGECFFGNGIAPGEYSAIDGERCFVGMSEARNGKGLYGKMLSEGWRWSEVAAWHFWLGGESDLYFNSWKPVCVLCREWNWTFGSKVDVTRTLKLFNSTRYTDPIEVAWSLIVGGKSVAGEKKTFTVPAGETQEYSVSFKTPKIKQRTAGEFILTCSRGGKEIFREVKKVTLINPDMARKPDIAGKGLVVVDPQGSVRQRLLKRGIKFTAVESVESIPATAEVVVVGKDAVAEEKSTDPALLALVVRGVKVIVLEQRHPLHYQAIPSDLEETDLSGRIAFPEDLAHSVFSGLEQSDFFTWSGDHIVYRHVYKKATRGAKSLVQCDDMLNYSALSECQVGEGTLMLCQLVVGEKLGVDPVATMLFDNLLAYAVAYKPVRKHASVLLDASSFRGKLLGDIGLKYDSVADVPSALAPKYGIAIIDASTSNLRTLIAAADKVKAFTDAGGWIMLWGLTPDGLADYNKLVGFEHAIRPFNMERVVFSAPRSPLTAGLSLRDVVMDSGKNIFGFMALKFPAEDEFSYVVDYDEVGPFLKLPTPEELGKPSGSAVKGYDHWPQNMVNNYTSEDTWRLCYSIILDRGDKTRWTMELPKEEEITNFGIVLNVIYHKITKINLYFDNDPVPFTIQTRPTHDRQDFEVKGRKCRKLTIEIADWERSGSGNVIGIDNFWVGVKRPESFLKNVKPLLNVGGLVTYQKGKGGILLNQLNIVEREANPVNAEKKAAIVKTVLRNLGAVYSGAGVAIGTTFKDTPIKIPAEGFFNAYLKRAGVKFPWFGGHPVGDLSDIPSGVNRFGGTTYEINDFRTSPVPTCMMLKGWLSQVTADSITGIKIGQKCDVLNFLQTYNATPHLRNWKADNRNPDPPVLFKYVAHYADGKTVDIPVVWRQGVGHWLEKKPSACMNAVVAWAAPFANDTSGDKAVVYSMQWLNPRPDVAIDSIDMTLAEAKDYWGAPALLAITASKAE